ncbi:hypothetical protein PHLCEN_2v6745 [Hermanssonia centrifuga]|uniref:Uncharacterized protein n=1 Tax=Hermanssonia centrifuga TaxID=98765 RepID=A0A2R6NYH3_9APHY|nr:hypothetical protein PHLCEN_2v6745 [Hermanssonia centrifuga]
MPFPFSFKFSVPGVANPFTASTTHPAPGLSESVDGMHASVKTDRNLRRPPSSSSSLAPPQPLSRKRGWVPSSSEISIPQAVSASTNGYLDTPAKYRDMAHRSQEDEVEEMVADLPPPKRRKTLAGSIVSTAVSAALIGTAVGLTVYRLWRNRGKNPETLPPPPYEQGEWVPPSDSSHSSTARATPSTPHLKSKKQNRHTTHKRVIPRRKAPRAQPPVVAPHAPAAVPPSLLPSVAPEFQFGVPEPTQLEEENVDMDDQMDWMGDQLAKLIEQGKRALGSEIVVMSEAKEDAVDNGLGDWVEEDNNRMSASTSGSLRSRRRMRPSNIGIHSPPPTYASPKTTPITKSFNIHSRESSSTPLSVPNSPKRSGRRMSVSSGHSFVSQTIREDEATLEPELREAMERARQTYLQRKQQASETS